MISPTIASVILSLCALALFALGLAYRRGGRPGKALLDFICGASLLIVAYYVATELG